MRKLDSSGGVDPHGVVLCASCHDKLPGFIEALLAEQIEPEGSALLAHLQACVSCAAMYGGLVPMTTAAQLNDLELALVDVRLQVQGLGGLLNVWRIHLGLRNQFDDPRGAAAALSVVGMIHRQRGATDDAREVHQLAIETWPGDSISRVMSEMDLAYLALKSGHIRDAVGHLATGSRVVMSLGDRMRGQRIADLRSKLVAAVMRKLLPAVHSGWFAPAWEASPSEGETILVANRGLEVPVRLWQPLEVDRDGRVHLAIGIDVESHALPNLFVLDVLFIPTGDVIWQRVVDADARNELTVHGGLEITADLPEVASALLAAPRAGQTESSERRDIPRRACELRIWWPPETDEPA